MYVFNHEPKHTVHIHVMGIILTGKKVQISSFPEIDFLKNSLQTVLGVLKGD